jgi:hypothetical protein
MIKIKQLPLFFNICLCYLLIVCLLYPFQKYFIDSDGISYLSIAKHYANGNWAYAINGFWSPMISWLLAIFIYNGIAPLLAAKIIIAPIGIFALLGTLNLAGIFKLNSTWQLILHIVLAPLFACFAYTSIPVDFLNLSFLIWLLYILLHHQFFNKIYLQLLVGFVGALCYFSKQYCFPFFILFFTAFHLLTAIGKWQPLKTIIRSALLGFCIFFITCIPWMYLLNAKYNTGLIYGTTAKINYSQFLNKDQRIIKPTCGFFLAGPHPLATDHTEDPFYMQDTFVHLWDSSATILQQFKMIKITLFTFVECLWQMSVFIFALILIIIAWCFYSASSILKPQLLYLLLFMMLFPLGYLAIHLELRYIWINVVLSIFIATILFQHFYDIVTIPKTYKIMVICLVSISFLVHPFYEILFLNNQRVYAHLLADRIKKEMPIKGKIFSNTGDIIDTQLMAFLLDMQLVIINPNFAIQPYNITTELKKANIDYYFYWHWQNNQADTLSSFNNYENISGNKFYGLQIFKLKK